jgi:hypothetical protein
MSLTLVYYDLLTKHEKFKKLVKNASGIPEDMKKGR